jgi:hypothetical protein
MLLTRVKFVALRYDEDTVGLRQAVLKTGENLSVALPYYGMLSYGMLKPCRENLRVQIGNNESRSTKGNAP